MTALPPTPTPHALRDYQIRAIAEIRGAYRAGNRSVLYRLPTGGGKTVTFCEMLRNTAARGKRAYAVVHRGELVDQISETVRAPHGLVQSGVTPRSRELIQICSLGTLANRLGDHAPDFIVWDEAHHCAAATYRRVLEAYPNAFHLGVSATPVRHDGKGLNECFDTMISGPTVPELIQRGSLVPTTVYIPLGATIDLSNVRRTSTGHDYNQKDLAAEVVKRKLVGDYVDSYRQFADGRRTLIYGVNLEHAEMIADVFNAAGYRAARIDGSMTREQRRAVVAEFKAGRITHLTSVALVGEGFDLPGIEAQIDAQPGRSLGWLIQKYGRGMRPAAGKDSAIYIDMAANSVECAHHPNHDCEWSLDGVCRASEGEKAPAVYTCDACYRAFTVRGECPWCGFLPESVKREIEHEAGLLREVQELEFRMAQEAAEKFKRKQELKGIPSEGGIERLQEIARERGHAEGWVRVQVALRRKYNPNWGKSAAEIASAGGEVVA